MSFYNDILRYNWEEVKDKIYSKTKADVLKALKKVGTVSVDDFMALLSPAASTYLEEMAKLSRQLTLKRFGNTIQLYIPLYLSNQCTNGCVYCGFNHNNPTERYTLSLKEIENESKKIKEWGFEHILLVTGEHPKKAGFYYIQEAIKKISGLFSQISIEIQPLQEDEYSNLADKGLHGVYIYQETYNKNNYPKYHPTGKKADFKYRIDTPERIGKAGIRKAGLGILLGLEDWRVDSFFTALHLRYLQQKYWKTNYSVSFPRLRPFEGNYHPNHEISDAEMVQLICAYRIFDENIELALSTRENPWFRDNVFPLGVTTMSAGSKTEPGGYCQKTSNLEQFHIADERSPEQIKNIIEKKGYEAVWKNWDQILQA